MKIQKGKISKKRPRRFFLIGTKDGSIGNAALERRGNSLCAIKKNRNILCVSEKVRRSSAPLLQLFCALHATAVSLGSNAVKLKNHIFLRN